MLSGIIYGFMAALMQSVSYLFSAIFIARFQSSPATHLIMVHLVIGLLALITIPLTWHEKATEIEAYYLPLFGAAITYMFAQYSLYQAINHSVASRVSPLLGLKTLVLAVMGVSLFEESYNLLQWAAVGLCAVCAVWLSGSGGKINKAALIWILVACVGYALSDISILHLMQHFSSLALSDAALLSVSLCYLLCGAFCLLFWPRIRNYRQLIGSIPAAISWFSAMLFLFACFAEIGVVFGGIVQSSRGLISIMLAVILVGLSFNIADPLPPRGVLIQRITAASFMLLAIGLFSLEKI